MPNFRHCGIFGQTAEYLENYIRPFVVTQCVQGRAIIAVGDPNDGLTTLSLDQGRRIQIAGETGFDAATGRSLRRGATAIDAVGSQLLMMGTSATGFCSM